MPEDTGAKVEPVNLNRYYHRVEQLVEEVFASCWKKRGRREGVSQLQSFLQRNERHPQMEEAMAALENS